MRQILPVMFASVPGYWRAWIHPVDELLVRLMLMVTQEIARRQSYLLCIKSARLLIERVSREENGMRLRLVAVITALIIAGVLPLAQAAAQVRSVSIAMNLEG